MEKPYTITERIQIAVSAANLAMHEAVILLEEAAVDTNESNLPSLTRTAIRKAANRTADLCSTLTELESNVFKHKSRATVNMSLPHFCKMLRKREAQIWSGGPTQCKWCGRKY